LNKKFRLLYEDGCNGLRLGDVVEARVEGEYAYVAGDPGNGDDEGDEDGEEVYWSRNNDGLFEAEDDRGSFLVPLGE
jgi:hypothetical protein